MTDFKKILMKYHVYIIYIQAFLIAGALYNQTQLENANLHCESALEAHTGKKSKPYIPPDEYMLQKNTQPD